MRNYDEHSDKIILLLQEISNVSAKRLGIHISTNAGAERNGVKLSENSASIVKRAC